MIRLFGAGVGLTALVTAILAAVWGRGALVPGIAFGALATGIQLAAAALMRPVREAGYAEFARRWGIGMALRFLGVVVFAVVVLVDRALFPPLPTAFAYVGVVVPLLFVEIYALK